MWSGIVVALYFSLPPINFILVQLFISLTVLYFYFVAAMNMFFVSIMLIIWKFSSPCEIAAGSKRLAELSIVLVVDFNSRECWNVRPQTPVLNFGELFVLKTWRMLISYHMLLSVAVFLLQLWNRISVHWICLHFMHILAFIPSFLLAHY